MNIDQARTQAKRHADSAIGAGRPWTCRCRSCKAYRAGNLGIGMKKAGRPRLGQPISITLTDEQLAWVDAQVIDDGSRAEVVREIIREAMAAAGKR